MALIYVLRSNYSFECYCACVYILIIMSGIETLHPPLNLPLGVGFSVDWNDDLFWQQQQQTETRIRTNTTMNTEQRHYRRRRRRVPHSNRMIRGRPTLSGDRRNIAIAIQLYGVAIDQKPPQLLAMSAIASHPIADNITGQPIMDATPSTIQ